MNQCSAILTIAFAFWLGNVVIVSPSENVTNADELVPRSELLRNVTKQVWMLYLKEKINAPNASNEVKAQIIVNIMPTLWTMGLKEEFAQGREWIDANFGKVSKEYARGHMNELVGGLLACYALTNDTIFGEKALEIAIAPPGYAAAVFAPWGLIQSVQSNWSSSLWPKDPFMVPQQPGIASMPHANPSITEKPVTSSSEYEFSASIRESVHKLSQWKTANTIPGYVIGVSVRGKRAWTHWDGYADIENGLPVSESTVIRIASISKSVTAALLGKMIQEKKIDLDRPIRDYLRPEQFPDKEWEGKKVDITLRQLVSHLGGIRHYKEPVKSENNATNNESINNECAKAEYLLNVNFPTVTDSLKLFKDDPLVAKPGTKYVYSTFGWTLISAVMETQLEGKDFPKALTKFLTTDLGMRHTALDENAPLIYNRARYYLIDPKSGLLKNVPTVDNSYKWAGGGLVSTVGDLLKFGNAVLYSFKGGDRDGRPGFLDKMIVDEMWTPAEATKSADSFGGYGIGWLAVRNESARKAFAAEPRFSTLINHSGGAMGATSLLIIEPEREIVVALIINLGGAGELYRIVEDVTEAFTKQIPKIEGNASGNDYKPST